MSNSHNRHYAAGQDSLPVESMAVLGVEPPYDVDEIEQAYRQAVKTRHPDVGGSLQDFLQVQQAYEEALAYVRNRPRRNLVMPHDFVMAVGHGQSPAVNLPQPRQRRSSRVAKIAAICAAACLVVWLVGSSDWLRTELQHTRALREVRALGAQVREDSSGLNVSLRDLPIDDGDLSMLSHLVGLQTLDLRATNITDQALWHIAQCKELVDLDLSYTPITNKGIADLAELEKLRYLRLDGTRVTAHGLEPLMQLPDLEKLTLEQTSITRDDLLLLQRIREGAPAASESYVADEPATWEYYNPVQEILAEELAVSPRSHLAGLLKTPGDALSRLEEERARSVETASDSNLQYGETDIELDFNAMDNVATMRSNRSEFTTANESIGNQAPALRAAESLPAITSFDFSEKFDATNPPFDSTNLSDATASIRHLGDGESEQPDIDWQAALTAPAESRVKKPANRSVDENLGNGNISHSGSQKTYACNNRRAAEETRYRVPRSFLYFPAPVVAVRLPPLRSFKTKVGPSRPRFHRQISFLKHPHRHRPMAPQQALPPIQYLRAPTPPFAPTSGRTGIGLSFSRGDTNSTSQVGVNHLAPSPFGSPVTTTPSGGTGVLWMTTGALTLPPSWNQSPGMGGFQQNNAAGTTNDLPPPAPSGVGFGGLPGLPPSNAPFNFYGE